MDLLRRRCKAILRYRQCLVFTEGIIAVAISDNDVIEKRDPGQVEQLLQPVRYLDILL